MQEMLRPKDVQRLLKISERTFYRMVERGQIPVTRYSSRMVWVPADFVIQCTVQCTTIGDTHGQNVAGHGRAKRRESR